LLDFNLCVNTLNAEPAAEWELKEYAGHLSLSPSGGEVDFRICAVFLGWSGLFVWFFAYIFIYASHGIFAFSRR